MRETGSRISSGPEDSRAAPRFLRAEHRVYIECFESHEGSRMPGREDYLANDVAGSLAALCLASMALTEFSNAFSNTPLPMVRSTRPSSRPLRFLPSRDRKST